MSRKIHRHFTDEFKQQIVDLHNAGMKRSEIIKALFPKAKIVLDRFHIVQYMNRALNQTRIQIMKQYDKKSLEYRALKYYWKLIQKDSRKLSLKAFYSRTFRETLTPRQCLDKIVKRNAFGYRNFDNFKKRIYLALNSTKEKTTFVSSRA